MTRLWRRAHEYLLVLTVLILVQTGWTFDEPKSDTSRKLNAFPNTLNSNLLTGGSYVEIVIGTSADATTLQYYLSHWNGSTEDTTAKDDVTYYGEGLQDVFFHSSAENNSLILADLSRCMQDFVFVTCLKLLLIKKLDNILDYVNDNNLTRTDFSFGNGIVSFKSVPGVNRYEGRASRDAPLGLDEDITYKVMELFKDRSLNVNLLPGVGVDVKPVPGETPGDFIGFKARPFFKFWHNDGDVEEAEGRSGGGKKKKKGGFQMPSMMMLPQLIMWGFMPFALANLQAMVMNAFMLNMMALNSAIFMTIRNLVFGPRGGPKVKYVNYGYRKKKKSSVPTIIVHSPAAFVKQPFHLIHRHKKPHHHHHHPHHGPPKPPPHIHHNEHVFYHDDTPASFSEGFHTVDHGTGHGTGNGESYDEYQTIDFSHPDFPSHHGLQNGVEVFKEDGHPDFPPHHGFQNGVEVFKEDGHLDGKNRVRIRINEHEGPSVKEVLHRIREIENHGQGFKPSQYDYQEVSQTGYSEGSPSGFDPSSADNTPWTVSDHSASHTYSDIHSPQSESEDYVISNDQNQFTPMRIYPKKTVGH